MTTYVGDRIYAYKDPEATSSTISYKWSTPTEISELGANSWAMLIHDGSKFIAFNPSGSMSTSTDGGTWTAIQSVLSGYKWHDFAYGNGTYVLIGGPERTGNTVYVATSSDCINWTVNTSSVIDFSNKSGLVYNGEKFILIDNYGSIYKSTDGSSWTKTDNSLLGTHYWNNLVYNGSMYVAFSNLGWISTSTDGETWTTPIENSDLGRKNWMGLSWTGNQFAALGNYGWFSTSTDGINWTTAIQDTTISTVTGWVNLAYGNTIAVALTNNGYISKSIQSVLPTILYTNTTNLIVGMTLYDNTGTDTGYKVGKVLTADSFDLLKNYQLNVEGYTYTADSNENVVLTGYTGSNTDVVIPNLEEV